MAFYCVKREGSSEITVKFVVTLLKSYGNDRNELKVSTLSFFLLRIMTF